MKDIGLTIFTKMLTQKTVNGELNLPRNCSQMLQRIASLKNRQIATNHI